MDPKSVNEALSAYGNFTVEKLIEEKRLSPLAIGDEVYLVSEPDKLLPKVKKVKIVNIIQDSSKTFNFEAKVKHLFSDEDVYVYFKDEDINEKVFRTKEELIKAGLDD